MEVSQDTDDDDMKFIKENIERMQNENIQISEFAAKFIDGTNSYKDDFTIFEAREMVKENERGIKEVGLRINAYYGRWGFRNLKNYWNSVFE